MLPHGGADRPVWNSPLAVLAPSAYRSHRQDLNSKRPTAVSITEDQSAFF